MSSTRIVDSHGATVGTDSVQLYGLTPRPALPAPPNL